MDEPARFLYQFINKDLKVECLDRRIFQGNLACVDTGANIVLRQTYEYMQPADLEGQQQQVPSGTHSDPGDLGRRQLRFIGIACIPSKEMLFILLPRIPNNPNDQAPFRYVHINGPKAGHNQQGPDYALLNFPEDISNVENYQQGLSRAHSTSLAMDDPNAEINQQGQIGHFADVVRSCLDN
ncbi:hypothetical protein FKW77_005866 [Venturia effusa]|uniref:Sm domain-containing protein n=1 Tax=Venturia effusa TaxID=50376 RepID=A0A517KWG9_9PEZI|nr:hypothetical protein FKW77_005866 [Venturia effusa]